MNPLRILIVEDEALVAEDLRHSLTRLGYNVAALTDSAAEAISAARQHRPDLVLSDIQLVGPVDGIAAACTINQELDIPVIFLTAHADGATLDRARQAGPFGYVVKPYTERDLCSVIEIAVERRRLERRVKDAERLLAATLRSIGDAVIATDRDGQITFMNPVAEALTGFCAEDSLGQKLATIFLTFDPVTRQTVEDPVVAAIQSGQALKLQRDKTLIAFGGMHRPIDDSCAPIRDEHGQIVGGILVFRDVSERKQQEKEREALIVQLQVALANVKTLSGLLPICMYCKKIRDDQGYWQSVEAYLQAHSEAAFTHGMCPTCFSQQVDKLG